MQQALTENLDQFDKDILTRLLEELPVEQRLQGLSCRNGCGNVAAGTVAGNVAAGVCGRPERGREGTISRVVPGERRPLKIRVRPGSKAS